jgi:hypothetical protein
MMRLLDRAVESTSSLSPAKRIGLAAWCRAGKIYIDLQDNHIAGTGQVCACTKADSVTLFEDFKYSLLTP